ncbi:MAG: hypothetical protein LBS77_04465 [Desulfovibrio sp.]|nr:hypothetical protein [Desulfovibrio sp.]
MKKMRRLWTIICCCALSLPLLAPSLAFAAKAEITIVADTRFIDNSILHWWAQMYNNSHLAFALMTMAIIPILGGFLGFVADFFMKMTGIDLEHRELAEK